MDCVNGLVGLNFLSRWQRLGRGGWEPIRLIAWMCALWLALVFPLVARAEAQAQAQPQAPIQPQTVTGSACVPQIVLTQFAMDPHPERSLDGRQAAATPHPPADGWQTVELPHQWQTMPLPPGEEIRTGWYRIEWKSDCVNAAGDPVQVALGVSAISAAGAVYSNDDLIWSDASLVEPMSASWNSPRWWQLPRSTLHDGTNTLWVRVTGFMQLDSGLGKLTLGNPEFVFQHYEHSYWRQRTGYILTAVLSGAVGCIFLIVFLINRSEQAYGWYAIMCLAWVGYLSTLLATSSWPFQSSLSMTRLNVMLFVAYAALFCQFTWSFGGQHMPRLKKALLAFVVLAYALLLFTPDSVLRPVFVSVWVAAFAIFIMNCAQFPVHAWRTREPRHLWLAACWLTFIVVAMHDLILLFSSWRGSETLSSLSGPIATVFMAVLLGSQLGSQMRRIARFNEELKVHVNDARLDLSQALEREHVQRLKNAKAQERQEIAHDLHDGLGASLVRSMAIVEQAAQPLPNHRIMSLLKTLRDDLRQVIDYGSSAGATAPKTPIEWMAPLRYRFTNILDDLEIDSDWQVPAKWTIKPTTMQCLALTRVIEEALSNVIKHSRAKQVQVVCSFQNPGILDLSIRDNGVGLNVEAVQRSGLSVGLRSMEARAQRMNAEFQVTSREGETLLRVLLPLTPPAELPV